uniref:aECM cysteine-cradle domain-containing protein n=1 Tax=Panagrolaimus superbus TaxID=310955 RepID=A0A914YNT4_9BILA
MVKKQEITPEPKPQKQDNKNASITEEKKEEPQAQSQNATKEITYQNGGEKVDKSKPYFVVNNEEWQLVVPQPDNKPALQIPVKDFTKLTEAVARASARSGMPVDMAKMVAAEELHVKSAELTTSLPLTVTSTTKAPPKKIEKIPASAFLQESESLKSEEEEKSPTTKPPTEEEEVITLNGKVYKLVTEEKPKKKKTKKTKKAQSTGQTNSPSVPSTTAPTTPQDLPSTTPPTQANGVQQFPSLIPVQQLPAVNQPFMSSTLGQYQQQQPLTYEQQQILAELQQRYLQSQAPLTRQQPNAQIPYVQNVNAQQLPVSAISAAQQMQQPYYQKVSAPVALPQMPSAADQIPMKIQHYPTQAVITKAAASPVKIIKETPHHIDPYQTNLPKQKIYSLQELDKYYNMQNFEATTVETIERTVTPKIVETTTQKVYAPHKQIKIRMNSHSNEGPLDEDEPTSKTTVVDATADAVDEEKKRIAELRRKFAIERQQLSRRHRSRYEKTTNLEPTTPPSFTITEQHCYNIKSFAKQAGSSNVYEYAISHCNYIENYYPDLKCENVGDYIKVCQQYYSTRRMLFT